MSRIYDQYCPVARALEFVGERWTLLVVRELMLGPRRFTDLIDELPGISTNVLTTRLKDLEDAGIVRKRTLPPPAGSTVYELTEESAPLAPVLVAMAQWGMTMLERPRRNEKVSPRSLVLALAVTAPPFNDLHDATYEFAVDDELFELRVDHGNVSPRQGAPRDPDAVVTIPARTLAEIAIGDEDIDRLLARGAITIEGDDQAGARELIGVLARS